MWNRKLFIIIINQAMFVRTIWVSYIGSPLHSTPLLNFLLIKQFVSILTNAFFGFLYLIIPSFHSNRYYEPLFRKYYYFENSINKLMGLEKGGEKSNASDHQS